MAFVGVMDDVDVPSTHQAMLNLAFSLLAPEFTLLSQASLLNIQ